MKNLKFILVAGLMAVSAPAFAQFANTGNAGNKRSSSSSAASVESGYSRIELSYNPVNVTFDTKGADDVEMKGLSLGYVKGFNISKSTPLYVETGLRLNYAWHSDKKTEGDEEDDYSYTNETKTTFVGLTLPINLAYRFALPNSEVTITPFVGVTIKGNLIANTEQTYTETYDGESESAKRETNWFDDEYKEGDDYDEEKEYGYGAKRLQFGWNIGAGVNYKSYYLGFSYGSDLSELYKKAKTNNWAISVGYSF